MKNPKWHRDELILALDLYFRHSPSHISKTHPEIIELSRLLKELPIYSEEVNKENFRNPNAVYMKLCNFLSIDPDYTGAGLRSGGKGDQIVWDKFAHHRELLHKQANAIKSGYMLPEAQKLPSIESEEEAEFPEGRIFYRLHRSRERSLNLVKKKKRIFKEANGRLFCEVCGFDFGFVFGCAHLFGDDALC